MKTIPLTQGYFTKVDDEDYEHLASVRWCAGIMKGQVRAIRNTPSNNGERKTLFMSRIILNAPKGKYVDHINGDSLDNRKRNLRFCTLSQNSMNRKIRIDNKSGYKGVYLKDKKWASSIRVNGKLIFLGSFITKKDAAIAYNLAAKKYQGKFSKLNIIRDND